MLRRDCYTYAPENLQNCAYIAILLADCIHYAIISVTVIICVLYIIYIHTCLSKQNSTYSDTTVFYTHRVRITYNANTYNNMLISPDNAFKYCS